ncbi:hypothetical protein K4F52_002586 [Lecanicillium sp. MT-2017a]|nr:hypothetical protein K4F52_002586 [Lecanicillium sp. MT-2017a]
MDDTEAQRSLAEKAERKERVAIIGTGLAGLTAAYLLHNDKKKRYEVTLFEQAETLALDTASVTVKSEATGITERVDVPPRSYCTGYYANLCRMYDHLNIPAKEIWHHFIFTEAPAVTNSKAESPFPDHVPDKKDAAVGSYFAYAEKWRALLSPRSGLRAVYLFICHMWFLAACFLVAPHAGRPEPYLADVASDADNKKAGDDGESLREYLRRIRVPRKYATHHLLPILCVLCSCTHRDMEDFPASDVVGFIKGVAWRKTKLARNGVQQVQSTLVKDISDVRLRTRVTRVVRCEGGMSVGYESRDDKTSSEETFARVVLAVSPTVAAKIFEPCRPLLGDIPTAPVITSILGPASQGLSIIDTKPSSRDIPPLRTDAQFISFRTVFADGDDDAETESLHYLPSGAISRTSCRPSATGDKALLHRSQFTRTLRTPASRRMVQMATGAHKQSTKKRLPDESDVDGDIWVNGRENVWITGSWCWDGMVVLEGCVVSAMRVARDFDVEIPWE